MKILGIIITYYPNLEDLTTNILQFIDDIDTLIIWQNTPISESENYLINADLFNSKVILMGDGTNVGIAYALNHAYRMMLDKANNYTHLLTMDQDSKWVNFRDYIDVISMNSTNVIYSPNINNQFEAGDKLIKVKTCITSGAIFSLEVLRKIGKFNEVYSVDCVDYDFSFKAAEKGVDIFKIQLSTFLQVYGEPMKNNFFNLNNNGYSSKRLFFIARNHILLWRDYPSHLDFHFKRMILSSHTFGKMIKVVLMEENKADKIIAIAKGFYAGITNNRQDTY